MRTNGRSPFDYLAAARRATATTATRRRATRRRSGSPARRCSRSTARRSRWPPCRAPRSPAACRRRRVANPRRARAAVPRLGPAAAPQRGPTPATALRPDGAMRASRGTVAEAEPVVCGQPRTDRRAPSSRPRCWRARRVAGADAAGDDLGLVLRRWGRSRRSPRRSAAASSGTGAVCPRQPSCPGAYGDTCPGQPPTTVPAMDVEAAIRTRRTHKAFQPDPVPREILDELFDLARWAPNHNLTNPVALPGARPAGAGAAQGGGRARGGGEARPRADAGRLLVRPRRRPGPGRGGPPRDRLRRLHRAARRALPAGWPATGGRPRSCAPTPGRGRRRAPRERALRQPDPPRRAGPGAERARARAGRRRHRDYLD